MYTIIAHLRDGTSMKMAEFSDLDDAEEALNEMVVGERIAYFTINSDEEVVVPCRLPKNKG